MVNKNLLTLRAKYLVNSHTHTHKEYKPHLDLTQV